MIVCFLFSYSESLEVEIKEKIEKMNKFKSVAIKAKKEIDSIKEKVILYFCLPSDVSSFSIFMKTCHWV